MAWTTPRTWVTNEVLSKALLDEQVRDNLAYLKLNIALEAAGELTISSGAVTKSRAHHTIDTESDAASDDLATILGGAEGEVILLRAAHTDRTVVLKTGTGNIVNPSGIDVTLNDTNDYCLLAHNGTNWIVIGGGAESDLAAHVAAADPHTGYLKESDLTIDLGTELAPAMTQLLWTEGAGWTITDLTGIATRVASAVTTLVPTTPITADVDKQYILTFTISSWTAGHVIVTFGGTASTSIQGDQDVHLYINPTDTSSLIFTPNATGAFVISDISLKEYTGGELTIEGGINYYDSRGHANRLSHVTRHIQEMSDGTLLDKSYSSLSCADGVLTYTLNATYGEGTWNFKGVVYPTSVASASIALTAGTDAVPVMNYVYFRLVNNVPTLSVSATDPTGDNCIMVAEFIVGAVSGSSYTIYGYNRYRVEVDSFIKRVIQRTENAGTLYESGGLPTVTQGTPWISVASGAKWYSGIFKFESANTTTGVVFYYLKEVAGVNNWFAGTQLSDLLFYTDGTAVANHGYANIVWGIVPVTTTLGGTVAATVKLIAVLQSEPTTEYTSLATVRQDSYEATNYFPPDTQLKEVFVPIARTIISEDADTQLQTFDTGIYWKDLRGRVTSGGGAATSTDTSGLVEKSLYDAYSILFATTDDTPIALTVNEQEVIGRMTGGTIDGIALGIADNNIVQMDDAGPAADNDYAKFTANGLEGRSYSEVKSDLTLNLVENTAHSTDAHTMTIDGVDVSAHAAMVLGAHGLPADPGSDKYLMWDDSESALAWAAGGSGGLSVYWQILAAETVTVAARLEYAIVSGVLDLAGTISLGAGSNLIVVNGGK
jgi:hypothetical protein